MPQPLIHIQIVFLFISGTMLSHNPLSTWKFERWICRHVCFRYEAGSRGVPFRRRRGGHRHSTKWEVLHPEAGGHRNIHVHVEVHPRPQIQAMGLGGGTGENSVVWIWRITYYVMSVCVTGKHVATVGWGCKPDCESQWGFIPALRSSLRFSIAGLETMETAWISQPCNCIIMTSDCHCDVSVPLGDTSHLFLPRFPSVIYSSLSKMCWLNTHWMKGWIFSFKNEFVKSSLS